MIVSPVGYSTARRNAEKPSRRVCHALRDALSRKPDRKTAETTLSRS